MTGPRHAAELSAARQAQHLTSSPHRQIRGYAWLVEHAPRCNDAVLSRLTARVARLPRPAGMSELRRALPGAAPELIVGAAERLWPTSSPGAADRTHTRPPANTNTPP
jgi:hypothetical protein